MSQRLPPLSALHVFEAAARHDSFQRAGHELHLSAGAVAHQVKQLEAWLGLTLFQRLARGVALTAGGRRYAEALRPLLAGLAEVSEAARHQGNDRIVTVTANPSFVTRWLMPRLGRLRSLHPEIDLHVLASVHTVDFVRDGVDLAIRLGTGPYPGLKTDILLEEWFIAVCSPTLLAACPPLSTPADILRFTLLHDEAEPKIPDEIDWIRWLRSAGVHYPGNVGPHFSHTYLTLEAAASGQGIALAPEYLVAADIRSSRLVQLFSHRVRGPYRYHLLCPPETENRPQVHAFCQWIRHEIAKEQDGTQQ
jgi:LysR family transcriptional regulator, glycine cleavage system transcriptional activator